MVGVLHIVRTSSVLFAAALIATCLVITGSGFAFADTEGTTADREAAADRLLQVQKPMDMLTDMASQVSRGLPEDVQQAYVDALTEEKFVARFTGEVRAAMAKTFTVAEMDALAEFYAKPVAKSAMAKMGTYMSGLMPFLQTEMVRIGRELQAARQKTQSQE